MPIWGQLLATLAAALGGGGLVTALNERRRRSGTVDTSDAGEVFKAMKDLLDRTAQRADSLEKNYAEVSERLDAHMNRADGLRIQLEKAQQLAERLRDERRALQREVAKLTTANAALDRMNAELQAKVEHLTDLLARHEIPTDSTP